MTRPLVYISGPLTTGDRPVLNNVAAAIGIARQLIDAGFAVICPHLTYHADPNGEVPHDVWMEIDKEIIRRCDLLVRFGGASKGADIEEAFAYSVGLKVSWTTDYTLPARMLAGLNRWRIARDHPPAASDPPQQPQVGDGVHRFETGAVRSSDCSDHSLALLHPIADFRIGRTSKEGERKYSAYNWEKGMDILSLLEHAREHIALYLLGDRSEDHLAHAAWNCCASLASEELWPEMNHKVLRPSYNDEHQPWLCSAYAHVRKAFQPLLEIRERFLKSRDKEIV